MRTGWFLCGLVLLLAGCDHEIENVRGTLKVIDRASGGECWHFIAHDGDVYEIENPEVVAAFKRIFPTDTADQEQDLNQLVFAGPAAQNAESLSAEPLDSLQVLDELSSALDSAKEE